MDGGARKHVRWTATPQRMRWSAVGVGDKLGSCAGAAPRLRVPKLVHPAQPSVGGALVVERLERLDALEHLLGQVEVVVLVRRPEPRGEHLPSAHGAGERRAGGEPREGSRGGDRRGRGPSPTANAFAVALRSNPVHAAASTTTAPPAPLHHERHRRAPSLAPPPKPRRRFAHDGEGQGRTTTNGWVARRRGGVGAPVR